MRIGIVSPSCARILTCAPFFILRLNYFRARPRTTQDLVCLAYLFSIFHFHMSHAGSARN